MKQAIVLMAILSNAAVCMAPSAAESISEDLQSGLAHFEAGDYDAAAPLFERACYRGSWEACINMAETLRSGLGVSPDPPRACRIFFHNCSEPYIRPNSCGNLGLCFYEGVEVSIGEDHRISKNWEIAADLFKFACENGGEKEFCANLAVFYNMGIPGKLEPNCELAVHYNTLACSGDKPNALGCANLGTYYFNGCGVAADIKKALGLFVVGCKGGAQSGCDLADSTCSEQPTICRELGVIR